MYVGSGFAFLGNAETLPQNQNKGFHSALIAARMNDIEPLGLGQVFTDVVPGSQSHNNCERLGFNLRAVNQIWERRAAHDKVD